MKINPYMQVQQTYNPKKVGSTKKAENIGRLDDVVISSIGREYQVAKQAEIGRASCRERV